MVHYEQHSLVEGIYTKDAIGSVMPVAGTELKGIVSPFYHDFERFKNTPRPCITQQKWFYVGQHQPTNDSNPLGSEDG